MNGTIEAEDKALYSYGLHQGVVLIANIMTTMFIGAIMGMFGECIIFMLSYVPLRTFAGGFHASTPQKCYLLGIVLTVCILLLIKMLLWTGLNSLLLLIVATVIIWILAPVADANKPLSSQEIAIYGHKARLILSVTVICCMLFWILGLRVIVVSIIVSLLALAIALLLGKRFAKVR